MMAGPEARVAVETYEQVPYPSRPYPQATASRLAAVATLFGLRCADPRRARVLEIGCAGGGNLIPRAAEHPESRCLGIDPAAEHVAEAERTIADLGLRNVRVERRGVEDLTDDDGPFDYIIAHGVFSWVPVPVRDRLLAQCGRLLAPDGVAYVSYNTLPGWHLRTMVRDAMLFHGEGVTEPAERVGAARAMLDFLADCVPRAANPWGEFLVREKALLDKHGDTYLFHDHLAPDNRPLYVREFVDLARAHGLEFLGEADLHSMMTFDLPFRARRVLESISTDIVRTQQYLDFLVNRAFRHTLLVRRGTGIDRALSIDRVRDGFVASDLRRAGDGPISLKPDFPVTFERGPRELQTADPSLKAAFAVLQDRFGEPIPFASWVQQTAERLAAAGQPVPADLREHLGRGYLHAVVRGLAELWTHPLPLGGDDADRPAGWAYARRQVALGCPWGATSRRHFAMALNPFDRALLELADGTRDRAALREGLFAQTLAGRLVLASSPGQEVPASTVRDEIRRDLPERLAWLARHGLLAPPSAES